MGRKPISIFVLSFGILALALSGLTLEWWQFFLTRFCVGVSVGGTFVVVFIYCIELVLPEHRLLLTIYPNWGTARIVLNTVCYFFPNWRHASCDFYFPRKSFVVINQE
uniref:Major facilitator superfamily (MFS) profile domain-containing protein n=1 Tax=Acrobeloides nanus TaxID=290746 RepID=A0A914DN85_9BILA